MAKRRERKTAEESKAEKPRKAIPATPSVDRRSRLDAAVEAVRKRVGTSGTILGATEARRSREYVRTGSLLLDQVLGGGWVKGRVFELFGSESAGKTTLAISTIREVQRAGGIAAYVDAEHALDWEYLEALGVDLDALVHVSPDDAESALAAIEELVDQGTEIVAVDTVAALSPKSEEGADYGAGRIGQQARLMSEHCRRVAGKVRKAASVLLFVNQIREQIGVTYGNPETTPGGRALKFYSSTRIEVRPGAKIKEGSGDDAEIVGRWCKVFIEKAKTSIPLRRSGFPIIFGKGISRAHELLYLAEEAEFVEKKGAWYVLDDRKYQGEANLVRALEEDRELANALEARLFPVPVQGDEQEEA